MNLFGCGVWVVDYVVCWGGEEFIVVLFGGFIVFGVEVVNWFW